MWWMPSWRRRGPRLCRWRLKMTGWNSISPRPIPRSRWRKSFFPFWKRGKHRIHKTHKAVRRLTNGSYRAAFLRLPDRSCPGDFYHAGAFLVVKIAGKGGSSDAVTTGLLLWERSGTVQLLPHPENIVYRPAL